MFCADTSVPSSGEDVFPMWLQKKLAYVARQYHPDAQPHYTTYVYDSLSTFQEDITRDANIRREGYRVLGARPAAYKLPDVCETCNRGWMSRLEEAGKLVMVGLIAGKSKLLTPYDQF